MYKKALQPYKYFPCCTKEAKTCSGNQTLKLNFSALVVGSYIVTPFAILITFDNKMNDIAQQFPLGLQKHKIAVNDDLYSPTRDKKNIKTSLKKFVLTFLFWKQLKIFKIVNRVLLILVYIFQISRGNNLFRS